MAVPDISSTPMTVKMHGGLDIEPSTQHVTSRDLRIDLNATPSAATRIGELALALRGDMDLRLNEGTLAIATLQLQAPRIERDGIIANLDVNGSLAASFNEQRMVLKGITASGSAAGGALGETTAPFEVAGDITLSGRDQQIDLSPIRIAFDEGKASGEVHLAGLGAEQTINGRLSTAAINLRQLLTLVGVRLPAMRDANALTDVNGEISFALNARRLELPALALNIDGASIQGHASSPDLTTGALRFDLTADGLDLDRYLPLEATGAPPSASAMLPKQRLRELDIQGTLKATTLRYSGLDLRDVAIGINAGASQLALSPLSAQVAGGRYQGQINIDARGERAIITIDEKLTQMDLHALLSALGASSTWLDLRDGKSDLALKATLTTSADGQRVAANGVDLTARLAGRAIPRGPVAVAFQGDVDADLSTGAVTVDNMSATLDELNIIGVLDVTGLQRAPTFKAQIKTNRFNPRRLVRRFGLPFPRLTNRDALSAVLFEGTVQGDANAFDAAPMRIALDNTNASGRFSIKNFRKPAIRFALDVDRFNADAYLPAAARGKAATPGAVATVLPVELIRLLDVDGTLKVNQLTVSGLRMKGVAVTAKAADGQLTLSPLGAALYGGRYDGNVRIDARQANAIVHADERIQNVHIGELLQALRGDAPITGRTDLTARVSASGRDTNALLRTLNGDVQLRVDDGALKRVNMVQSMCGALASIDFDKINKKTLAAGLATLFLQSQTRRNASAQASGTEDTPFSRLSGSARITNGIAHNNDLVMASPVVNVTGDGTVDLVNEHIDYNANAELVRDCAGIGKRELAGHIIPVKVHGPLQNPKVEPSIPSGLIQALTRRREHAPAPGATSPTTAAQPDAPAQLPKKPAQVLKDARDELLKGILGNILKQ